MKYIKNISILAVVVLIAIVIGWKYINKNPETIKIGALYPLTGGLASYGAPAFNTAKIAVEDINNNGGIGGKTLELVAEDHKCDPKAAVSAFEKLSGTDNIKIFATVACSGTVLSVVPTLENKHALLLGTITSASKLTGVSPYFFRNWASDDQEAKLLADRVMEKGYKNIAIIYEETDYAKGLKISLENDLKNSNVKITSESFVSGATDVRTQLTKLQSLKPDLVFVSVQTVPSGELILTQMEQLKFVPLAMFINDNILKASDLVKNHASLLEGAIGGDYTFPMSNELKGVLDHYKEKYGMECPQINICAAEYDAIQILAQGISEKGNSAEGVKGYLSQVKYQGVSGDISFDSQNDRSNTMYSLFEVRLGSSTPIK